MEAPDEKAALGAMLRAAAAAAALLPLVALRPRTWSPRRMVNILCGWGRVGVGMMSEDRGSEKEDEEESVEKHAAKATAGQAHRPNHLAPGLAKLLVVCAEGVVDWLWSSGQRFQRVIARSGSRCGRTRQQPTRRRVRGPLEAKQKQNA